MTKQKRILVTVSPSTYELVKALGDEAHIATSQLIGEMIEEARPAFETMLASVREAKEQQLDAYDTVHRFLLGVQTELNSAQMDLLDSKSKLMRRSSKKVDE